MLQYYVSIKLPVSVLPPFNNVSHYSISHIYIMTYVMIRWNSVLTPFNNVSHYSISHIYRMTYVMKRKE